MQLRARLQTPVRLIEDLFFAAGIVSLTTTWFMLLVAISWRVLAVPDHLMLELVLLMQVVPVLAITAGSFWLGRRSQHRARLVRALLGAAAILFIGLHFAGLGFELFANDLSSSLARWSAFAGYLLLIGVIGWGVVRICLRHQQMTASIFRTLGVLGVGVTALLFSLLTADFVLAPAYALSDPTPGAPTRLPASSLTEEQAALPPVFLLVFDELSYDALLDQNGQLDRQQFPNFARLADQSMVFTDARSNFFDTGYALPSLLESLFPFASVGELRLYMQYRAVELAMQPACSERIRCVGISEVAQQQTGAIFRHLVVSFAESLLPGPFSSLLRDPANAAARIAGAPTGAADSSGVHLLEAAFETRFLDDLRSDPHDNSITVLHTLTTHHPYVLDAGGTLGGHAFGSPPGEYFRETFHFGGHAAGGSDQIAALAPGAQPIEPPGLYDAYRAQIRYADELLGRFLDTLEAEGLLQESIVILTADHGLRLRFPSPQTPIEVGDWITRIPLFIHAPDIAPGTSNAEVQYQDIAPTVFDLLDLVAQARPTTASAFAADRPPRSPWFVVTGTWIYHRATDGTWPAVANLPESPESYRGSQAIPALSGELIPCFAQPETCTALPLILPGTPEFEAAFAAD